MGEKQAKPNLSVPMIVQLGERAACIASIQVTPAGSRVSSCPVALSATKSDKWRVEEEKLKNNWDWTELR